MGDIYRDVTVTAITLYAVSKVSFVEGGYTPIKYPLRSQGVLSATIIEALRFGVDSLSSTGKLSGTMFDKHLGSTIVGWSDIGNADFSITRQNVAGQAYMNWQGQVYGVKKLGLSVIVYGRDGITQLLPKEQFFGINDISSVGIKGRNAFTGTEHKHFFINQFGTLCMLVPEAKMTDRSAIAIGGISLFKSLSDSVVLSYDENLDELYIATESKGYKVSFSDKTFSITETYSKITGVGIHHNTTYIVSPDAIDTSTIKPDGLFRSSCTDFTFNGFKTIINLEVETDGFEDIYGTLYYSDDNTNWYTTTEEQFLDNILFCGVTAKFFKIALRIPNTVNYLNSISANIQFCDRRVNYTIPVSKG